MEPLASLTQYGDWALLLGRLALGLIFLVHGWGKLRGAKGFYKGLGLWETVWSLAAIVGFLGRPAGLALGLVMLGALYMKIFKWKAPFTAMDKTGYELDLTLLALGVMLWLLGAGGFALDSIIWK